MFAIHNNLYFIILKKQMKQSQYEQRYKQVELLGRSVVDNSKLYLIKDTQTTTYKMSKKISLYEDTTEDQLLNEISILRNLSHPHIIKYHDVYLQNQQLISILEFCEQGDMFNYLHKRKKKKENISEKLIVCWIMQVLMGLEYIHGKSIVHRLVDSKNVYMNHQGDLKLGSFGNAKVLENTIKKAMSVVTEPCNMSPEMVMGKPYDSKADIWALGCLVYQMTTFQPLYKMGGNLANLYDLIVEKPVPDLPSKYAKYLNPIFKKMMKKNPSQRPSASQLLQQQIFIKLMKEYIKKKKIDSLDLKYIVPKKLAVHKTKKPEQKKPPKVKLPPLNHTLQQNTPSFSKQNKVYDNILPTKQPMLVHKDTPPPIISKKNKSKQDKMENSGEFSQSSDGQTAERITSANLEEGLNISSLYEIKLEMIMKKYKPNMSQIYQQTLEFDDFC